MRKIDDKEKGKKMAVQTDNTDNRKKTKTKKHFYNVRTWQ
jgi:hypothetical protein